MKSRFLVLLLCIFSLTVWAQAPIGTCKTCGKVISTCPYKGNHPVAPKKCGVCGRTNCPQNGHHKKCPTCGQYDFKCRYNFNHPCSQCGKVDCNTKNKHEKCPTCGEYDFKCEYNLNHPCSQCGQTGCPTKNNHKRCSDCGEYDFNCEYNLNHPQVYEVSFACNVAGAKLYVDGEYISTLPLKQKLEAGDHGLTIKADGYKEFKKTILVGQDSEKEFHFLLESTVPPAEGTVTDSHGRPLHGASIIAKGTTKGSMADANGRYIIKDVKNGQTLRAVFIGYKPVEQVWNSTPLNFVLKAAPRKDVHVGVTPTFQVGRTMAVGASLDFSIRHFCFEAGYLYGLSSQKIYWVSEKYGSVHPESIRPVCIAPLRLGYGISAGSHLRFTPQIGVNLMQVAGDVSGCYATSAAAGLRVDFTLAKHFGLTLTPEYIFPIQKSTTYQRLLDCGAKDFASSFNFKIGFNIFL